MMTGHAAECAPKVGRCPQEKADSQEAIFGLVFDCHQGISGESVVDFDG